MSARAPAAAPQTSGGAEPRASRPGAREMLRRFLTLREGSIVVVTIIAAIYFAIKANHFATHANFITLLPYFAPFAILAVGEVMLMVAAEIDLSIGSVYLFCPFMFYEFYGLNIGLVPCLILALLCCAVVGMVNGVITEVFGVSSFITTLGMLLGLGGLTLIISHAAPVAMPGAEVTSTVEKVTHVVHGQKIVLEEHVNHIGTFAKIFGAGTYSEFVWALLAVGFVQVVLSWTLGHVHGRGRRQQARRGRGRREGAYDRHPQLRAGRAAGRLRGDPRGQSRRVGATGHRGRVGDDVPRRVGGGDRRHAAR